MTSTRGEASFGHRVAMAVYENAHTLLSQRLLAQHGARRKRGGEVEKDRDSLEKSVGVAEIAKKAVPAGRYEASATATLDKDRHVKTPKENNVLLLD